jgi:hypothetical protein
MLTVEAHGSDLAEILRRIAADSGMTIDGLGSGAVKSSRIFGNYGPGDPRAVLMHLLTGSGYNFVMAGETREGTPQKLLLTAQTGAPAGPSTTPTASSGPPAARSASPAASPNSTPQPQAQPPEQEQPSEPDSEYPKPAPNPPPVEEEGGSENSPEPQQDQQQRMQQLLERLQQMHQQQGRNGNPQ